MQLIRQLNTRSAVLVNATATLTAAATSAALDTSIFEGPISFLIVTGAISATNTTTVTIEESDASGSGFAASDESTFTIITADASALKIVWASKIRKRYVRLSYATPTGSSPSTVVSSVVAVAQPKLSSTASGHVAGQTTGL